MVVKIMLVSAVEMLKKSKSRPLYRRSVQHQEPGVDQVHPADCAVGMGECADPDKCKSIADLGINFLAAGIGNIHGKYPENWQGLSFETLEAIKAIVTEKMELFGSVGKA